MISLATLTVSKLVGTFALFLGLLGWQWVSIQRTLREDRAKAERESREGCGATFSIPCSLRGG